jgi:hypothetical protein
MILPLMVVSPSLEIDEYHTGAIGTPWGAMYRGWEPLTY